MENFGFFDWNFSGPEEERNSSLPTYSVHVGWKEKPNDPNFQGSRAHDRKKRELSLDIAINPNQSGRIIINYPGLNESVDGPNLRYHLLASQMQTEQLGAVVRSANPWVENFLPTTNLKMMIKYSLNNSALICQSQKPEILLMGFSAGASAVAALTASHQAISRILLIAPSGDMPKEYVQASLQKFTGEVYIVIGANDEVVGPQAGQIYYNLASASTHKELFVIPNCDHYFHGEINDKIFKKAPFYAFKDEGKPTFP